MIETFYYEVREGQKVVYTTSDLFEAIQTSLQKHGSRVEMTNMDQKELAQLPPEEISWKMIPVWVKCEGKELDAVVQSRGRPPKRKLANLKKVNKGNTNAKNVSDAIHLIQPT